MLLLFLHPLHRSPQDQEKLKEADAVQLDLLPPERRQKRLSQLADIGRRAATEQEQEQG